MSKISTKKQERIMSNIVSTLYQHSPQPLFTSEISDIESRDEEFVKKLLIDLQKKGIVRAVKKNPKGLEYKRRTRWMLSQSVFEVYSKHQN